MAEKRLGRGLDFLIPSTPQKQKDSVPQIPLRQIRRNRFQPREVFDDEKIQELALSIKENGVLQPILVRQEGSNYELIAGERRLKACSILRNDTIPAIILDITDAKLLEFALVENIQRENLSSIEEAHALQMFVQYQGLTHEEIATKIGKHRTYVTNLLRLLELPEVIQADVSRGTISAGHARALLGLSSEKEILAAHALVVGNGLSVRKTEELVKTMLGRKTPSRRAASPAKPPHIIDLEGRLRERFDRHIDIQLTGEKGKVLFSFHSEDDLGRLFNLLDSCTSEISFPEEGL